MQNLYVTYRLCRQSVRLVDWSKRQEFVSWSFWCIWVSHPNILVRQSHYGPLRKNSRSCDSINSHGKRYSMAIVMVQSAPVCTVLSKPGLDCSWTQLQRLTGFWVWDVRRLFFLVQLQVECFISHNGSYRLVSRSCDSVGRTKVQLDRQNLI